MGYYMAGGEYQVTSQGSGGATFADSGFIDDGPPRRPSMNKWNGRALTRSMRRVNGFMKMARKAVNYAHRVKMRKRRR